MQKKASETFLDYLKIPAYWLGFKSPRWTLLIGGPILTFIFGLSRGWSSMMISELFFVGVLYYFYRKDKRNHQQK